MRKGSALKTRTKIAVLGARPKTYARGGKVSRFGERERFNGKDWERTSEDEQDPRNIPFPLLGDEHGPISYPPTATPQLRVPSIAAPEEDSPIQPWRRPPSELKMRQLEMVVRRRANEVDRRLQQKVEEVGQRATRASRKYGIEADLRSHGRMEVARKTIAFYEEKRLEREEAHQAQEEQSKEIALRALNSMQIVVEANQRNYEKYEGSLDCVKDTGKRVLDELLKEIMRVNSQGIERVERVQGEVAEAMKESSTKTEQAQHRVKDIRHTFEQASTQIVAHQDGIQKSHVSTLEHLNNAVETLTDTMRKPSSPTPPALPLQDTGQNPFPSRSQDCLVQSIPPVPQKSTNGEREKLRRERRLAEDEEMARRLQDEEQRATESEKDTGPEPIAQPDRTERRRMPLENRGDGDEPTPGNREQVFTRNASTLGPPLEKFIEVFDGQGMTDFEDWYGIFNRTVKGYARVSPLEKQNLLRVFLKGSALDTVNQMEKGLGRDSTLEEDLKQLRKMFNASSIASLEDVKRCRRQPGEDIRRYSIRLRKVVDRCGDNLFNNETSRANAVLAQFKQGIEDTHLTVDLCASKTVDDAIEAYNRIDELRTQQSAARARSGESGQHRPHSPLPRRHESPYNDRSRRPTPTFNREQRLVGAIKGTRQEKETEKEQRDSSQVSYVSGQSPRRPNPNPPVGDRYGQSYNPDHYCEYHRSVGHWTAECRGLLKKQAYYDALSGEQSLPPPPYPQYPAMAYRGPGQNGTPYGHNRPFNPAIPPPYPLTSSLNPAIQPLNLAIPPSGSVVPLFPPGNPPFYPQNQPNRPGNFQGTGFRGRGQESYAPRGGYYGQGRRGNPPSRGTTRPPNPPHHNVFSLNFDSEKGEETQEDTDAEGIRIRIRKRRPTTTTEGSLIEIGMPLTPRTNNEPLHICMFSNQTPRTNQTLGFPQFAQALCHGERQQDKARPTQARDEAIPATSRMGDRSSPEAANRRIGASTRTRPWAIDPAEPVEQRGRTVRKSPTEQFEEFKRRYEEWDLNVLEAEVGRKNDYPAPVLRPIRWNSSTPDNQRDQADWGRSRRIATRT